MSDEKDVRDYVKRCLLLEKKMKELSIQESSSRVWIAVMGSFMIDVCIDQDNPRKSLKNCIETLFKGLEWKLDEK